MKKFFSGFLVLCLSLALLTACGKDGQTGKTVAAGGLTFAKSYSEVYSALTDAQKAIADRDKSLNMTDGASDDPESGGKGDGEGEGTFYSGTNVQVAGVDEGDIVKTDGTYIYILRGSELIVMQADGADVTDVSNVFVGQDWEQTTTEDGQTHTQEKLPLELYLADGRAVVLSSYTDWTGSDTSSDELSGSGNNYVTVDIYDVSRLCDLTFMMREDQVHSSSVNIEVLAQILASHGGTFGMPSGETVAPWRRPAHDVFRLRFFPEGEVGGITFFALSIEVAGGIQYVVQVAP